MAPYEAVAPDTPLGEVARRLQASGLPQLPVAEGGAVQGFVGEDEIARAAGRLGIGS